MKLGRLNHIGIATPSLAASLAYYRDIMGATNPADADEGTIRKTYAESIEANSVHGSDSDENAAKEIAFFFDEDEIVG